MPTVPVTAERLTLVTPWSRCEISLFGAQVLSFAPAGGTDLLWTTPIPKPLPAPIRGGIPLCWPWFARQGVDASQPQHGHARTAMWRVSAQRTLPAGEQEVELQPCERLHALSPTLRVTVGAALAIVLDTRNDSEVSQPLTQALHTYLAVGDVARCRVRGLDGAEYLDNRDGGRAKRQAGAFESPAACERIYHGLADGYALALEDDALGRRVAIAAQGSGSVVVWNPGADLSQGVSDLPAEGWRRFLCVEVAHAGPDARRLAPGEHAMIGQVLRIG
jgi:glucose-6-phosphate 1-epimerase